MTPSDLLLIATPLIGGSLVSSTISTDSYDQDRSVGPPRWVFPATWTILYLILGYSAYRVGFTNPVIVTWWIGLILNWIWTPVYFGKNDRVGALYIIRSLIVVTIYMAIEFYGVDKTAGLLQLPYLAWLVYAMTLNQKSLESA